MSPAMVQENHVLFPRRKMPSPRRWFAKPGLLLLPNVPLPLHGVNPRTVLGAGWWNKTRKEAYASTDYHCEACGTAKQKLRGRKVLEAHEVYEIDYTAGKSVYVRATPLCPWCHKFIHDGRLLWLYETQQITAQHYASVLRHGQRVLATKGLERESLEERDRFVQQLREQGQLCPWADWRLVVDGREFPPKYKTADEQSRAYLSSRYGNHRIRQFPFMPTLSDHRQRRRI